MFRNQWDLESSLWQCIVIVQSSHPVNVNVESKRLFRNNSDISLYLSFYIHFISIRFDFVTVCNFFHLNYHRQTNNIHAVTRIDSFLFLSKLGIEGGHSFFHFHSIYFYPKLFNQILMLSYMLQWD